MQRISCRLSPSVSDERLALPIHFWFNVAHIAGLVAFLYLLPPRLGLDEPVPREIRRISAQTPGGWLGQHWMWVALVLRRSE
jgi:hypothetical protein